MLLQSWLHFLSVILCFACRALTQPPCFINNGGWGAILTPLLNLPTNLTLTNLTQKKYMKKTFPLVLKKIRRSWGFQCLTSNTRDYATFCSLFPNIYFVFGILILFRGGRREVHMFVTIRTFIQEK